MWCHVLTIPLPLQLVSGGDIITNDPCVQLAGIDGINALLADADPCAQQDNADAMIDFAKSPGVTNADALIANAIAYRQHARNAFNINGVVPATPYCTRPPRNSELEGLVNAQLEGVNPGIYGNINLGLFAFGAGEFHCYYVLVIFATYSPVLCRGDVPLRADSGRVYLRLRLNELPALSLRVVQLHYFLSYNKAVNVEVSLSRATCSTRLHAGYHYR